MLEELLLGLPGFAFFKDVNGEYLGANRLLMNLIGYHSLDEVVGITDFDMKCDAVNYAENFQIQDKKAIELGAVNMFEVHRLADNREWVYLTKKQRLLDNDGNLKGVACHSTVVEHPLLINALMNIVQHDRKKFDGMSHGSYYLDNYHDKFSLTERESECLFYLLRGKSAREIGALLNISPRTVESYIENMKMKFNCKMKSDLIETAVENGLVHHLPKSIINPGDPID